MTQAQSAQHEVMMAIYMLWASGLFATVYGFGERYCGNPGKPVPCIEGIPTASGELVSHKIPQVAVPMPKNLIVRPVWISLRVEGGPCRRVRVVDKKNWRYIQRGGFDLNPKAVKVLTGRWPTKSWSAKVFLCDVYAVADQPEDRPKSKRKL